MGEIGSSYVDHNRAAVVINYHDGWYSTDFFLKKKKREFITCYVVDGSRVHNSDKKKSSSSNYTSIIVRFSLVRDLYRRSTHYILITRSNILFLLSTSHIWFEHDIQLNYTIVLLLFFSQHIFVLLLKIQKNFSFPWLYHLCSFLTISFIRWQYTV